MRTSVVRGLAVVAGTLFLATAAGAAEPFAKGMAVARELASSDGTRFLVTVRPPADRGVDPRIFDALEIVPGKQASTKAYSSREALASEAASAKVEEKDEDIVDVSDYKVRIEALAAAGCSAEFVAKFKKVNLNGKKFFEITAAGASAMTVTAFPTKGDVDTYVFEGSEIDACQRSIKPAGQLDVATCFFPTCTAAVVGFDAWVYNPFSSQATYVASFVGVFVN